MPETNILSASVLLTLGGKAFRLSYRAHAFITYAEVCQSDLLQDIRTFGVQLAGVANPDGINTGQLFARVRDMLWAGMLEADPNTDRNAVAHLFGFSDLGAIIGALTDCLKLTAPEPPARPTNPPEPELVSSRRIDGLSPGPTSETVLELQPVSFVG